MLDHITIIIAGIGTLAIFSYLFGENPVYRLFEHIFIGVAAGYIPYFVITTLLWPKAFGPVLGFGELLELNYVENDLKLYIILMSLFIGFCFYASFISKKLTLLVTLALTASLAISAGLSVRGNITELIPQVKASIKPLWSASLTTTITNWIFLGCLILTLMYFIFTFNTKNTPIRSKIILLAKFSLMICFGAFFGSTVSARLSLLIERIYFLKNQWWNSIVSLIF